MITPKRRLLFSITGFALAVALSATARAETWYVPYERVVVPPVARDNVTQLIEAGTVTTDGFSELVFSLGGEFKEGIPTGGTVGAILVPDTDLIQHAFQNEGYIPFVLEAKHDIAVDGLEGRVFLSGQQTARVAFPRYRVYLYNETTSGATVSLFIYRTRCLP